MRCFSGNIVARRSASQFTLRKGCKNFVEHVFNVLENWLNWHVENVPHVNFSQPQSVVPHSYGFASLTLTVTFTPQSRGHKLPNQFRQSMWVSQKDQHSCCVKELRPHVRNRCREFIATAALCLSLTFNLQ